MVSASIYGSSALKEYGNSGSLNTPSHFFFVLAALSFEAKPEATTPVAPRKIDFKKVRLSTFFYN
jgi:hypothetical protein